MDSKVIIIGDDIKYCGNIDDDKLHIMWLKDCGCFLYGEDSDFSKIDNNSSPNQGILEFINRGNIVVLNLSRFGDRYALFYFPHNISDIQRSLLNDVLNKMEGFEILSSFCFENVSENLDSEMISDSFDNGFSETLEYLDSLKTAKNKGI